MRLRCTSATIPHSLHVPLVPFCTHSAPQYLISATPPATSKVCEEHPLAIPYNTMASKLSTLLLLAAVLGAASASRAIEEPSGRQLLQAPTSADCDRSVKHCTACRYQFYRGTVTKVGAATHMLGPCCRGRSGRATHMP
jgi:hypothetical protein